MIEKLSSQIGENRVASYFFLILLAVICGICVTLQSQLMGVMDRGMGTLESVFITYGSGGAIIGILMLVARGGKLNLWQTVPPYVFTSGLIGLIIVSTIGYTVTRLGLVVSFTLILASQFTSGILVDSLGLLGAQARPIGFAQFAGVGLMLVGIWLVMR